jgi:PAS domain S-box-containing protein
MTEAALRKSAEGWQSIIYSHPDPLLILSNRTVVVANDSAVSLLGAQDDSQVLGRSVYDFLSAQDFDRVDAFFKDVSKSRTGSLLEHELIRIDGEYRIVEASCACLRFHEEDSIAIVLRDVTERAIMKQRQQHLFDTAAEGFLRIDVRSPQTTDLFARLHADHVLEHAIVTECNEAAFRILGIEKSGAKSNTLADVLGKDASMTVLEFMESSFRVRNRYISVSAHGVQKRVLVNAVGHVSRNKLESIWMSCVDVTERMEMEARVIRALDEQKQEIGRELHDGVGQFLTGVRILCQSLVEHEGNDGDDRDGLARKVARMVDQASVHMRQIYSGLTPMGLHMKNFLEALEDMIDVMNSVEGINCYLSIRRNIKTQDNAARLHLYRIIQESVNNAIKHGSAHRVEIRVDHRRGYDIIQIKDDGKGLGSSTRRDTSIGLASMRFRAEAIGAKLQIQSPKTGGTVVTCRVPVSLEPDLS